MSGFISDESGVGVIEMVLIIVVLIALVIVFRDRLNKLLVNIFNQIDKAAEGVY